MELSDPKTSDIYAQPIPGEVIDTVDRVSCEICNRKFTEARLEHHTRICERATERDKERDAVRAVKDAQAKAKEPDSPRKPVKLDEIAMANEILCTKKSKITKAQGGLMQKTYQCELCERFFKQGTFERHYEHCKEKRKNMSDWNATRPAPACMEKLRKRIDYKPPLTQKMEQQRLAKFEAEEKKEQWRKQRLERLDKMGRDVARREKALKSKERKKCYRKSRSKAEEVFDFHGGGDGGVRDFFTKQSTTVKLVFLHQINTCSMREQSQKAKQLKTSNYEAGDGFNNEEEKLPDGCKR